MGLRWPPETFIQRKLAGLAQHGVQATVASTFAAGEDWRVRVPGVDLIRLGSPGERRVVSISRTARDALALGARDRRLLAGLVRTTRPLQRLRNVLPLALAEPDVLHFEWESQAVRYLGLPETLGRPFVMSCRGSGVNVHPHVGLEQISAGYDQAFAKAAAVHCVCDAIRDEAVGLGLDPAKAVVIRSGVDATLFAPRPHEPAPFLRVFSVGTLHWIKNFEDAIRAIGLVAGGGIPVRYEIAGAEPLPGDPAKPSDRPKLLYLIRELGLEGHVELLGELPHDEVRARMHASDVLLHPSLSEGIPNSVLEAMACGLPVVVTDVGGTTEAVTDGVEGFVSPPRDPAALASALARLWNDRELGTRLGEAGRRRILADFSPEAETRAYVELYRRVLALDGALSPNGRAAARTILP
ncbi:MAG TPA: glycosyltransferase family 4 protein [Gaiellaceae bacterium]|nr:glycosyltransferase family 4 protein [Gaiellaceae bacterium]